MPRKSRQPKRRSASRFPIQRAGGYSANPIIARQPYVELKQYAFSSASTAVYAGAGSIQVNIVNGITQGVADNQRTGDHLTLQKIHLRFSFYNGLGATANQTVAYRIIVYQFLGDNNTVPTPANFLLTNNQNAGNTYGTWSFPNVDYVDQYLVLYDSMPPTGEYSLWTVGSASQAVNGSAGGPGIVRAWTCDVPLRRADHNIRFYAGGAFGPNHLYFVILSDHATIATDPTVSYSAIVRYTDA